MTADQRAYGERDGPWVQIDPARRYERVVNAGRVCALTSEQQVYCWVGPDALAGVQVLSLENATHVLDRVTELEASLWYVCAVQDGDVWCWDPDGGHYSDGGCCGETPTRMTDSGAIVDVAISDLATACALSDRGEVWCWDGPTGYATDVPRTRDWLSRRPHSVALDAPLRWMSLAGRNAFCGGDDAGRIHCWGFGDAPLLGIGRGEGVSEVATLWTAYPVDLDAEFVAGNEDIGCVFRRGEVRCSGGPRCDYN